MKKDLLIVLMRNDNLMAPSWITCAIFLLFTLQLRASTNSSFITKTSINVGTISSKRGKINVVYDYINSTGKTVTICRVKKTCGCLSVNYPKHPIKRNEKGKIVVLFDTQGLLGHFHKSIIIYSNDIKPIVLTFKGFITNNENKF